MQAYVVKIKESIVDSVGCRIDEDRFLYSLLFVTTLNVLSEVSFFLKTYVLSTPSYFVKMFMRRSASAIELFGLIAVVMCIFGQKISQLPHEYLYGVTAFTTAVAFFASKGLRVIRAPERPRALYVVERIFVASITSFLAAVVVTLTTVHLKNDNAIFNTIGIVFMVTLFGGWVRASIGRRVSLYIIAMAPIASFVPKFYIYGFMVSFFLVIIPSVYRYITREKHSANSSEAYTHRDLEVMKLFGQSSESGYAFEERIIPVIDSLGYDTKFARWYKDKKDYPPEYLNKSGAGDGGLDLIGMAPDNIMLVQCKFYNAPITAAVVAQLCTSRKIFGRYFRSKGDDRKVSLMIVTNSSFDSTAKANAKEEGVILVDGEALKKMISSGKFDKIKA